MFKIIYRVPCEEKDHELDWLRQQMVFPALHETFDWKTGTRYILFGVIVANDAALSIKLRHKLDIQIPWAVGKKQ